MVLPAATSCEVCMLHFFSGRFPLIGATVFLCATKYNKAHHGRRGTQDEILCCPQSLPVPPLSGRWHACILMKASTMTVTLTTATQTHLSINFKVAAAHIEPYQTVKLFSLITALSSADVYTVYIFKNLRYADVRFFRFKKSQPKQKRGSRCISNWRLKCRNEEVRDMCMGK